MNVNKIIEIMSEKYFFAILFQSLTQKAALW